MAKSGEEAQAAGGSGDQERGEQHALTVEFGVCYGCIEDLRARTPASLLLMMKAPEKRQVLVIKGVKLCEECSRNSTIPNGDGYTYYECDCYLQKPYDPNETRARIYKPGDPREELHRGK